MTPDGDRRRAYAVDVGSTRRGRFAWTRTIGRGTRWRVEGNASIGNLVDCLVDDLQANVAVALGFEAPMFIPVPDDTEGLGRGRAGEGSSSWCAPAGLAVTALGLHQMSWVLKAVASRLDDIPEFTLDWRRWWGAQGPVLYVWEAFVSGEAHARGGGANDHLLDAATAVNCFRERAWGHEPSSDLGMGVTGLPDHGVPVLSLASFAAKWAGWDVCDSTLRDGTLVLRPTLPFAGNVDLRAGPPR